VAQTKGIIPVDLTVGKITKVSAFFVVDGTAAYKTFLGVKKRPKLLAYLARI